MQCSQQPSPRDLGREGKRGNRRSVGRSIGLALVCACRMTVVVVRERESERKKMAAPFWPPSRGPCSKALEYDSRTVV